MSATENPESAKATKAFPARYNGFCSSPHCPQATHVKAGQFIIMNFDTGMYMHNRCSIEYAHQYRKAMDPILPPQQTSINKPIPFVIHCENMLGIAYPATVATYKARSRAAKMLLQRIWTNPLLFTWDNLVATVEYLRRRHITVTSAAGVCDHVQRAIQPEDPPVKIDIWQQLINEALRLEMSQCVAGGDPWIGRLVRCSGPGRQGTYTEWREARWDLLTHELFALPDVINRPRYSDS